MANSKRWFDDGAPPEIMRLLRAARDEAPERRAIERTLVVLGTAGTIGTATSGALGATTKAASGTVGWVVAKWGAATIFGLGLATTTVATIRHYSLQVGRSAPVASTNLTDSPVSNVLSARNDVPIPTTASASTSMTTRAVPAQKRSAATVELGTMSAAAVAPPTQNLVQGTQRTGELSVPAPAALPMVAETDSSVVAPIPTNAEKHSDPLLVEEMRLIDQARTALSQGRPADTLHWLDEYRRTCRAQRLMLEALLLRMQALIRLGERDLARGIAEDICAGFPNSPHALRAREYLDASAGAVRR